jgi:hypothetical protein
MMGPQQIRPARAVVDPVIECPTGDHHEDVPATSHVRGGPYLRSMRPDNERQANEAHRRHRSSYNNQYVASHHCPHPIWENRAFKRPIQPEHPITNALCIKS